ncbi:MAG: hypothetical protein R2853_00040 [Thermomicrobiales bacterium]
MNLAGYAVSDAIALPERTDYGIGVIGCGGIVNYRAPSSLPARRVPGCCVLRPAS